MITEYAKGAHLGNSLEQSIQVLLEIYVGGILRKQRRRNIVMSFIITNPVLELESAVLDQVSSSVNKTRCSLFGMLISIAAMLTYIVELIYEVRTKKLIWRWRGTLPFPWYYYRNRGRKPFGTLKDIVGLVCAFSQCIVATAEKQNQENHDLQVQNAPFQQHCCNVGNEVTLDYGKLELRQQPYAI
ncbi:hypothetical protein Ddye_026790 [Dipteronia dyeriana]|uniref:Uncharacterized protein n=1 Tax=Dipteronia dyeriana TaxID=168575 RepID=A0AAD9TNW6_9ROSI|nr:hypothetical protein Ddye_026790 [Dipteronia dyeriana]